MPSMSDPMIDTVENTAPVAAVPPAKGIGVAASLLCLIYAAFAALIGRINGLGGPGLWLPLALLIAASLADAGLGYLKISTVKRRRTRGLRLTLVALAGGAWGLGAWFWYVPGAIASQIMLTVVICAAVSAESLLHAEDLPATLALSIPALIPLLARMVTGNSTAHLLIAALICGIILTLAMARLTGARRLAESRAETKAARQRLATAEEKAATATAECIAAENAAAEQARQSKRIVAGISHELRTPFNALLGMAQLLDRAELPQPQRDQARIILEAGRSFKSLLDDIAVLAEDNSGIDTLGECDPVSVTRSVARLLQPMAWEKRLHLTTMIGTELPRVSLGPHALRQALLKLIGNALEFTPAGNIEIKVEATARTGTPLVRFTVSDTGLGVPPEIAPELFKNALEDGADYARHSGRSSSPGLGVAKNIIEAAGGEIGYESSLGEGSVFWFTVPALSASATDIAPLVDIAPPSGLKLLICLIDPLQAKTLSGILYPDNQLEIAANPAIFTTRATREPFDAIITTVEFGDVLAAAPGEKSPILMLKNMGQPAPTAGPYLAWPCPPTALYQALLMLLASQTTEAPTPPKAETVLLIDNDAINELEKSVGETTLVEILRSYLENTDKICSALEDAAGHEQWEDVGRLARDIAGSASGLGLNALTASARAFNAAVRAQASDAALQNHALKILGDNRATRQALLNLYPELDKAA